MPPPVPPARADGAPSLGALAERPPGEWYAAVASGPDGLSAREAADRRAEVGPNTVRDDRDPSTLRLLLRQFASPIELILVAATVLSGLLGDWTDATIILVILLLSGLLGFVQERGAGRAMRALLATVEVTATVLRDGTAVEVPVRDVVPGDVAIMDGGDVVPGDCLVIESIALAIDESALTGETFPREKDPGGDGDAHIARFGTHVVSGGGRLLVVDTGQDTEFARIASRLVARPPQTGFERGMTRFGLLLTRLMVVLVVLIFVANLVLGRPLVDSALFSLALAVGLTPQLLPAIVSIGLARGARRMAAARVIVRRLDAIEDFGSMTVLCSDKTGTMTADRIRLEAALDLDGHASDRVAELASLNAGLQTSWVNPLDAAVLDAHACPGDARRLDELPYDFDRKRLTVLVEHGEARMLVTKGALDHVTAVCTRARRGGRTVPIADVLDDVHAQQAALSATGLRVLGVATREYRGDGMAASDESGLVLDGLLTFADPVKPDAATTLAELAASGISVRMLTGDHRLTAAHVADQVGIDTTGALTGTAVDSLDDARLAATVPGVHVFSELTPAQKERIVLAYRAAGDTVGYLGDGINDAPPLHAADVGITVDSAVPVAKQSAAIVLLDKDLRVLLDGVAEGRRTFANTMKYIFMTTSANVGNMLSMAIAAVALPFLPLLAGQILLINLLSDLPAMAIATDRVDAPLLRRPQQWDLRLIRNYMFVFGAVSSVFDLATFAILLWGFGAAPPEFRSAWFVGSVLTEIAVLFALRTRGPLWRSRPGRGVALVSIAVALLTMAVPFSPLAPSLELVPIPLPLLGIILVLTLGYVATTEAVKRVFWRARPRGARPA